MSESHRTIFKSSALIGGVQVVNIFLGVIRTKVLALLLGPAGVGLAGLYQAATELVGTITGLGIGSSGVRQIAEAAGTADEDRIARTIKTVRRVSFVSGLFGMLVVLTLAVPLNRFTFGDGRPVWGMALMSVTLMFGAISAGQFALLKGLRYLKKLASSQVLGALFGTVASISLVYFLRREGIVPYLVTISAFGILTSWWFARQVHIKPVRLSFRETINESRMLLGMGVAFMLSALFASGNAYATRIIIGRVMGNEAVGLYQATWTLSTLYVSFILNAMLTDFYPRLTAIASDNVAVNRLVNEQTEMGLLIGIPGVIATITLAPIVLKIFYSGEFLAATEVIRWQSIGIGLRLVSWPMGFIQLAKGKSVIFILAELAGNLLYLAFILAGIRLFGLEGAGIAFVLLYLCSVVMQFFIGRSLSGFEWYKRSKIILAASCSIIILVFLITRLLPQTIGMIICLLLTVLIVIGAMYGLQKLLGISVLNFIKNVRQRR